MNTTTTRRALVALLFAVYLALLVWLVIWKLGAPYVGSRYDSPVKLVPFLATEDAGASAPLEVIANVLVFVLFGLYLRVLTPSWPWWLPASVVALTSLALEGAQYAIATGIADVSDVVANTTGGLIGIGLARMLCAGTSAPYARVMAATTGMVAIAAGAFVLSPQHLAPPGDVGPLACRNRQREGAQNPRAAIPTRCRDDVHGAATEHVAAHSTHRSGSPLFGRAS